MPYETVPASWCVRVRQARIAADLSVKELAAKAQVSATVVRRIETATAPTQFQDVKWAAVLRVLRLYTVWHDEQLRIRMQASKPTATVFLAAPMDSVGDGYTDERPIALTVLNELRRKTGLSVFYAGEQRTTPEEFEEHSWALRDNCRILDSAQRMVVIYPRPLHGYGKPLASSILIEMGYAIARMIPIMLFYFKDRETLPYVLRAANTHLPSWRILRYRDASDVVKGIEENLQWLTE